MFETLAKMYVGGKSTSVAVGTVDEQFFSSSSSGQSGSPSVKRKNGNVDHEKGF